MSGCLYTECMKKIALIILLALCLLLSGCGAANAARSGMVFAMDTVMNLTTYGKGGKAALADAERELYRLDGLLARGVEGSEVYVYNHEGRVEGGELQGLLDRAEKIGEATAGAFDIYLGGVLDLWGFGSGAGEYRVPTEEELSDAPPLLDLGGVAKGYAGERMFKVMEDRGVQAAVLDLGGDVALWGAKPDGLWSIAIADPTPGVDYLGVLEAEGGRFIMTSGVYERYFEENGVRYHHVIDPRTRRPADSGLVSVTVICESGVWADALATACCVMGAERSLELRESLADTMAFDLILVDVDGRVRYTYAGFTPEPGNEYIYEQVS